MDHNLRARAIAWIAAFRAEARVLPGDRGSAHVELNEDRTGGFEESRGNSTVMVSLEGGHSLFEKSCLFTGSPHPACNTPMKAPETGVGWKIYGPKTPTAHRIIHI